MSSVIANITTSVDGYIAGPDDGPGKGLGEGGERLHYWVFGGPWSYDDVPRGDASGEDAEWLNEVSARIGAVVGGRWTYEAARHWGDENPWGLPFFIVTHRPEEEPEGGHFNFVAGVEEAVTRAGGGRREGRERHGRRRRDPPGARRGPRRPAQHLVAPVILGDGKRLFDGFSKSVELEHVGVRQSPFATFIDYRVKR